MSPAELEAYLHSQIPITAAMQVGAVSVSGDAVVLKAPLAPNINHRETVFGGSASAVAILAAWALVHLKLEAAGVAHRLVIQRNTMSYDRPIAGEFTAEGRLSPDADWHRFVNTLTRHGKARITAVAELVFAGGVAGRLTAEFVAIQA
jgi:thioesterase domain-containing protein